MSNLKEITDICGINKHLTRDTVATTVSLANGVRIENFSAMMGHTNIKQTQHYAKVLDVNVKENMDKLKSVLLNLIIEFKKQVRLCCDFSIK